MQVNVHYLHHDFSEWTVVKNVFLTTEKKPRNLRKENFFANRYIWMSTNLRINLFFFRKIAKNVSLLI